MLKQQQNVMLKVSVKFVLRQASSDTPSQLPQPVLATAPKQRSPGEGAADVVAGSGSPAYSLARVPRVLTWAWNHTRITTWEGWTLALRRPPLSPRAGAGAGPGRGRASLVPSLHFEFSQPPYFTFIVFKRPYNELFNQLKMKKPMPVSYARPPTSGHRRVRTQNTHFF